MTGATGTYFVEVNFSGEQQGFDLREATLVDDDLIRGDDPDEHVLNIDGLPIFNGFFVFRYDGLGNFVRVLDDGEADLTVTFSDGTVLSGVSGLVDRYSYYGQTTNWYLLDQQALADAGYSMADVIDVEVEALTEHALNWSDLGFGGGIVPEEPPVEPPAEPPSPTLLLGTAASEILNGTAADEIIASFGGSRDILSGGGGADQFVFGAETTDGSRDRDIITDFDVADDQIVLSDGAAVASVQETRGGDVVIRLQGDGDRIILRDVADASDVVIVTSDDPFALA